MSEGCLVLRAVREVRDKKQAWDALLLRTRLNRAFASAIWYTTLCEATPGLEPYVVVLTKDEQVSGLLPLVIDTRNQTLGFVSQLADYNDVIAPQLSDRQLLTIAELLDKAPNGLSLRLEGLLSESELLRMRGASPFARAVLEEGPRCPYVATTGKFSEYMAQRGRRLRRDVRMVIRLVDNREVRVTSLTSLPDEVMKNFWRLHLENVGEASCFGSAGQRSLAERLLRAIVSEGRLLPVAAWRNDRLVGLHLCMADPESIGIWNCGVDRSVPRVGFGNLLHVHQIEYCFGRGLRRYDFMRGTEEYKFRWATGVRTTHTLALQGEAAPRTTPALVAANHGEQHGV